MPAYQDDASLGFWTWTCAPSGGVVLLKNIADGLDLGELVTQQSAFSRSLQDGLTLEDTRAGVAEFARSILDALVLGEAIVSALAASRSLGDPLSLAEAIDKVLAAEGVKAWEDDASLQLWGWTWTALPIVGGEALEKMVADGLTIGEAVTKALVLIKSISDGISVNEVLTKAMAFSRSVSDPIVLVDTMAKAAAYRRSLSDPLILADTLAKIAAFRRSLSDPLVLGDILTTSLSGAGIQTMSDPLTLADVVNTALIISLPGGTGGYTSRGYVVFDEALPEPAPKEPWPSPEERVALCAIINFITGAGE